MRKFPWPHWYTPPATPPATAKAKRISSTVIIREACNIARISYSEFMGPSKVAHLTQVRQAVVFALHRRRTDLSWPQIARLVGRTDHTTAIHAFQVAQTKLAKSPEFAEMVMKLEMVR